jgi:hypothetical protein
MSNMPQPSPALTSLAGIAIIPAGKTSVHISLYVTNPNIAPYLIGNNPIITLTPTWDTLGSGSGNPYISEIDSTGFTISINNNREAGTVSVHYDVWFPGLPNSGT